MSVLPSEVKVCEWLAVGMSPPRSVSTIAAIPVLLFMMVLPWVEVCAVCVIQGVGSGGGLSHPAGMARFEPGESGDRLRPARAVPGVVARAAGGSGVGVRGRGLGSADRALADRHRARDRRPPLARPGALVVLA